MPEPSRGELAQRRRARGRVVVAAILTLGTLAAFAQVRTHQFLNYDDPVYVTDNLHVRRGLTPEGIGWAFTTTAGGYWNPLTWLSHMLDVQLFGLDAGAHHLVNLALHIVNAVLLFLLFERTTGALASSAIVAALFAWHPLHVESVAWVAERKDVLSTTFWLLTMLAYACWYVPRPRIAAYALVLALFVLGLACKPMLVTLPFALLLVDVWPLGRVPGIPGARTNERQSGEAPAPDALRPTLTYLLAEKIPFLVLVVVASVVTYRASRQAGAVEPLVTFGLGARFANAALTYVAYIRKLLWPVDLACFYPRRAEIVGWQVAAASLVLLVASWLAIRQLRRQPYLAVGWFWYLGTLVPVIDIVQVGAHAMADRYTYVPFVGLFIAAVWGANSMLSGWRFGTTALGLAAGAALSACVILTWHQVTYWRSSTTLFQHALTVTTDNSIAHLNLGLDLDQQGKTDEAIAHYVTALRINPADEMAHNNLGIALRKQGKLPEAIAHYVEAIRLAPGYAQAHNNLGVTLRAQGKVEPALDEFSAALGVDPSYHDAELNLAVTLIELKRGGEAVPHLRAVLAVTPDSAVVHFHLATAWLQQGDTARTIDELREALRLDPNFRDARHNLGSVLASQAPDEAIAQYTEAIRIDAGFALGYYNRARVYQGEGEQAKADADFARAAALDPNLAR